MLRKQTMLTNVHFYSKVTQNYVLKYSLTKTTLCLQNTE